MPDVSAAPCGAITPNWPKSPCEHPKGHGPISLAPQRPGEYADHRCGKVYWNGEPAPRPNETTPIGVTIVYDAPMVTAPVEQRPRYTFLGLIPDDAEPGAYAWVASRNDSPPIVTPEIVADLLVVRDGT